MSNDEIHKNEKSKRNPFKDEIEGKNKTLVLFYASWCPFSKLFLPIFQEYVKSSPQECISIAIDDKPDLCEEYSIDYYPTVILFNNGKIHKRLDAEPRIGLNRKQFEEFTEKS